MPIFIATSSAEIETEVRRSRFIARAHPVGTEDEALQWIRTASDRSATHNCWAFRLENGHRCADDGEPGGTAGRPILAALEHAELVDVAVLVVRFFGGVKLGTGGLARAYGNAAAACIQLLHRVEKIPMLTAQLQVPYDMTGVVFGALAACDAARIDEDYGDRGLTMTLELPERRYADFRLLVTDLTRGTARFIDGTKTKLN